MGETMVTIYHKLENALDHWKKLSSPTNKIWVKVEDNTREYIVCDKAKFWDMYSQSERTSRLYHEMICRDCPCHLYIDLDDKCIGEGEGGGRRTMEQCEVEQRKILSRIQKKLSHVKLSIRISDSSNANIFSRHIVILINDGKIQFLNQGSCLMLLDSIFKGKKCPLIDYNIYSQNHTMRLLYSTKYGEERYLIPCGNSQITYGKEEEERYLIPCGNSQITCGKEEEGGRYPCSKEEFYNHLIQDRECPWDTLINLTSSSSSSSSSSYQITTSDKFPGVIYSIAKYIQTTWDSTKTMNVTPFFFKSDTLFCNFRSNGHRCRINENSCGNKYHRHNCVKFSCDLYSAKYYQTCFSSNCAEKHSEWIYIDKTSECYGEIEKFLKIMESSHEISKLFF